MNEKLKPCPFCGGEAKIVGGCEKWHPTFYDPDSGGDPYNIQCTCCSCSGGYYYEYWKAVRAWNTRANQSEKTDRWIPVSERLPENWVNVLTYDNYGNVHMMAHHESYESPFGIDKDNARFYEVQGWMPLPEPPKED